jgi:hypothetical protein
MKKILSLIVLLVALSSCEEDVQFNTPAVQGLKDNELWRAAQFSAVKEANGSLTVTANNGFETVTLKTSSVDEGEYMLGINEANKASYVLNVEGTLMEYQTGTAVGDGSITIIARDTNVAAGYITGNFKFNAEDEDGEVVNFQQGVFYKVPIQIIP